MKALVLLFVLQSSISFGGHGRDGGWPQSIQLFRLAKENLISLVKQANDQDVRDAINSMHDRTDRIDPKDVDQKLLLSLINNVIDPDVEKIEESTYTGVRLFTYDDSQAPVYRIFATKNFFNLERYQVNLNEINIALVKEVQLLILHEISHLWGFGEENPGINYARTFATRMIEILHGNFKKNYTTQEKMQSLSQAFSSGARSLQTDNQEFKLKNKNYACLKISENGESNYEKFFREDDLIWSGVAGHSLRSNENILIRGTIDDYLIIEELGTSSFKISSKFYEKGLYKRYVNAYYICHPKSDQLSEIITRFIAPYYSRSNLMTDLDYSSTLMFRFLIADRLQKIIENGKQTNKIQRENQNQIIHNIDFKIKVQLKKDWDWLINLRYTYSRTKDIEVVTEFNNIINSDLSTKSQSFHAASGNLITEFNSELQRMKNVQRQIMLNEFLQDFVKELNVIWDLTARNQKDNELSVRTCDKEKKIGRSHLCHIETVKNQAFERIQLYNRMDQELDSLLKAYQNRLQKIE